MSKFHAFAESLLNYNTHFYRQYFSKHLKVCSAQKKLRKKNERLEIAQKIFDNYIVRRRNIFQNTQLKAMLASLNYFLREYKLILNSLSDLNNQLIDLNYKLNRETTEFLQTFAIPSKQETSMIGVNEGRRTIQDVPQLIEQSHQL